MSKISKFQVNLISKLITEIENGKKQNHQHDLKQKCNEFNIRRHSFKHFRKPFNNISHRLVVLAQPKKPYLLSVFEQNLERITIFEIENFLNIWNHRVHKTPNQAICTIRQNLNQQNKAIQHKKHEIKNLKLSIHRHQKKNVAPQIDYLVDTLEEICLNRKKIKLKIQSISIQEQIIQELCQLSEELDFMNTMKPAFNSVPDCSNDSTVGLFQVKEYFPPIQPIGLNHIGKTLVWQTISSKYDCEQDVHHYSFNSLSNVFVEQQLDPMLLDIEDVDNLDLEIIEEQEIDSSMFKINKEDCEQLTQKGAAFQVEKVRVKAMRAMKKKPDDWKCLLNACNTPKWEVNWIDKDRKK